MSSLCRINEEFKFVRLQNLRIIATLGVGGFGRVELVQIAGDHQRSFALKQMKKAQVQIQPHLTYFQQLIYRNHHFST